MVPVFRPCPELAAFVASLACRQGVVQASTASVMVVKFCATRPR